ncbi:hypothetical protein Hanom_Chr05g00419851 [Helianthus anomalus]
MSKNKHTENTTNMIVICKCNNLYLQKYNTSKCHSVQMLPTSSLRFQTSSSNAEQRQRLLATLEEFWTRSLCSECTV